MDEILDSPLSQHSDREYAGFWIRVAAYLIDGVLLFSLQMSVGYLLIDDYTFLTPDNRMSLFMLFVGVMYFGGLESSERRGTLGKMACGIQVSDLEGNRLSFANAAGRYLAKILSAIILCIGFLMVAWDQKKQGLHDLIASTMVTYR